jgi:hypothetical protein
MKLQLRFELCSFPLFQLFTTNGDLRFEIRPLDFKLGSRERGGLNIKTVTGKSQG